LQAIVNRGGSKDHQTTSTLTITPTKEDDGARFRCVVFNRAMKDGEKYETVVTLSVNCELTIIFIFTFFETFYLPIWVAVANLHTLNSLASVTSI
jgi:hypothetical protein